MAAFSWSGITARYQESIAKSRAIEMAQKTFGFSSLFHEMATLWAAVAELLFGASQSFNVTSARFGAKGDGVTDDTVAIQAAINAALAAPQGGIVYLPAGRYVVSDTLHMGLGVATTRVVLRGDGPAYRGAAGYTGTVILPTFSDARPVVNMQGLRFPLIEGIWFYNATGIAYYQAQSLGLGTSLLDPSVATNWEYAPNLDTQFAPNAAITVDAYAGTQPATHYPTTGNTYGKSQTIKPRILNCGFSGFIAGVACQPSNADGNGDYLNVEHCWFEFGKWGISVGNSQSRSVTIKDCEFSFLYRWWTNNKHGKQIGKFGGTVINNAGFDCDGIFEFGAGTTGPIVFDSTYCESHKVLGNVTQTGSTIEYSYLFNGGDFKFHTQGDTWGVPQYILTGGNSGNFKFSSCNFSKFPSVLGFQPVNCEFDGGCQFQSDSARTNPYEQYADNGLAGGLVTPRLRLNGAARIKSRFWNLDTAVRSATPQMTDKWSCDRTNCIPFYGNKIIASGSVVWDELANPNAYQNAAGSTAGVVFSKTTGGTVVSFGTGATGKEMTIVFGARADSTFMAFGPLPGDVIYDDATGTVFFVHSRSSLTVLATAQNNYKTDGAGGYQFITAVLTTGSMYVGNSRLYTPAKYLQGTLTAASNSITVCGNSAGTAAYDVDIAVGDLIMVWSDIDALMSLSSAIITARAQATATITLTASAGVKTATRRLAYWARLNPANV